MFQYLISTFIKSFRKIFIWRTSFYSARWSGMPKHGHYLKIFRYVFSSILSHHLKCLKMRQILLELWVKFKTICRVHILIYRRSDIEMPCFDRNKTKIYRCLFIKISPTIYQTKALYGLWFTPRADDQAGIRAVPGPLPNFPLHGPVFFKYFSWKINIFCSLN